MTGAALAVALFALLVSCYTLYRVEQAQGAAPAASALQPPVPLVEVPPHVVAALEAATTGSRPRDPAEPPLPLGM